MSVASVDASGSVAAGLVLAARAAFDAAAVSSLSSAAVLATMKDLTVVRGVVNRFDAALRARAAELQPPPEPDPLPTPIVPDGTGDPIPDSGPEVDVSPPSLDDASHVDSHTGQVRERLARVLAQMPAMADALSAGHVAEHHIEVIAKEMYQATNEIWAALVACEPELVIAASTMHPARFARHVTELLRRLAFEHDAALHRDLTAEIRGAFWIDKASGLGRLTATVTPEMYAQIVPILRRRIAQILSSTTGLTTRQATGRAIAELLMSTGPDGSGTTRPGVPQVAVIIDERTLLTGAHEHSICEHPDGHTVDIDTARLLACDAPLVPVLHNHLGVAIDMGRTTRWMTPAQRTAMMTMYATCFHTACTVPVTDCRGHHITYWDHGGRTDMANLLPVCEHHHRWIHAHNPRITLDDRRVATVVMPNGTTTTHHPDRRTRQPDRQQGRNRSRQPGRQEGRDRGRPQAHRRGRSQGRGSSDGDSDHPDPTARVPHGS